MNSFDFHKIRTGDKVGAGDLSSKSILHPVPASVEALAPRQVVHTKKRRENPMFKDSGLGLVAMG
jgi:hypothetical protein